MFSIFFFFSVMKAMAKIYRILVGNTFSIRKKAAFVFKKLGNELNGIGEGFYVAPFFCNSYLGR